MQISGGALVHAHIRVARILDVNPGFVERDPGLILGRKFGTAELLPVFVPGVFNARLAVGLAMQRELIALVHVMISQVLGEVRNGYK